MANSLTNFNPLFNAEQVENLLSSITKIAPRIALVITDTTGHILIAAGASDAIIGVINKLDFSSINQNDDLIKKDHKPYLAVAMPLDIRGQQIGYTIGVSDAQVEQLNLDTTQLANQIICGLIYKEYELNSMSTDLILRYEEITLLFELGQDLGALFDITAICELAVDKAMLIVEAAQCYIALIDEDGEQLTVTAARDISNFVGKKITMGHGIGGRVAALGKTIQLSQQASIPELPTQNPSPQAVLSIPLILPFEHTEAKNEILGVMTVIGQPTEGMFTAGETKLLTTIMSQIAVAIYNTQLVNTLQEAERLQQQLEIAARIQQSLLPKHPPQLPGVAIAGRCISAANIGGDYYDVFVDDTETLNLLIADASGHSVGPALMMALARSTLRFNLAMRKPLKKVLADTNAAMFNDLSQVEIFITLFCARYQPDTCQLNFVNAGHNRPLLWRSQAQQVIELDTDGLILGVVHDVTFEEKSLTLQTGDILLLYTDGATEARAEDGSQLGEAKLQQLLAENASLDPESLADQIYQAIQHHIQNNIQQDDITLLILKIL